MTSASFLQQLGAAKRAEMSRVSSEDRAATKAAAMERRQQLQRHAIRSRLLAESGIHIIAEFKRRSPSAGVIRSTKDAQAIARIYEEAGAAAISVLTEPDHFGGSLADLESVTKEVSIPVLRKDFLVDAHQVYEAATAGASAVLLIAALLDAHSLRSLRALAEESLGMDALVEVHSLQEFATAQACGATLIGVNNRDLNTLEVNLDISRVLARCFDADTIAISESGLRTGREIRELRQLGYRGFLIGESLMRADGPGAALRSLLEEAERD